MTTEAPALHTRKILGEYIVADSAICHGAMTFAGTRIFVEDILHQLERRHDHRSIREAWRGAVCREAVAEAVVLASAALARYADDLVVERVPIGS